MNVWSTDLQLRVRVTLVYGKAVYYTPATGESGQLANRVSKDARLTRVSVLKKITLLKSAGHNGKALTL